MKKTITTLVTRIQEEKTGTLKGGFGSIRGGITSLIATNSDSCTNVIKCSGTNEMVCINEGDCSNSTNKTKSCTNEKTCFA